MNVGWRWTVFASVVVLCSIMMREILPSWLQGQADVDLDACPGYNAQNVRTVGPLLTADLVLAGKACNVYGTDVQNLSLTVEYEESNRIHLKITDPSIDRYEVPASVLPLPSMTENVEPNEADILFKYTATSFSFQVIRRANGEVLFNTTGSPIIFEPQYWRVKTTLPRDANIYGLGEHTDPFRLPLENTTRTLWSRDSYDVPPGTNLYGNHPVYFEHRSSGTHGVFLRSSNGMDIKISNTAPGTMATLEYNIIGGIIDMYFLAGSTTSPNEVAKQYASLVGKPAEVPYWSLGFHQCRYGYQSFTEVSQVIANYSAEGIPLETMWTDIDYMDQRKVMTTDSTYFPVSEMREIVKYLHERDQRYILMVDPAVAYTPNTSYGALDHGLTDDIFLKNPNGSLHLGVVWPGVTVYPDWFHPKTQDYWDDEFARFFDPKSGIDIDGVWIDMNEPASFCSFPCNDPFAQAVSQGLPPQRTSAPPSTSEPVSLPTATPMSSADANRISKRNPAGQQVMNPPYDIQNTAGVLSDRTAYVDILHYNGMQMYDTHNLYGTMMSVATRNAMSARRPGFRTFVITRSTFAGAGSHVGKWLGDNLSNWKHYRFSIAGQLGMAAIYQIPMVGSDVCGFGGNTTEYLCARWATLGAFSPFYRNHNQDTSTPQEFYRWPLVTKAAKSAIDIRYRLMDYLYTAFHKSNDDGTPVLKPMWFNWPSDVNTWGIDLQFLFGDSVLVSPVTEENSTSVTFYLPRARFYDFKTFTPIEGTGANVTMNNVEFTEIPLHIVGGAILPLRSHGAMTTTLLRNQTFNFVIAPDSNGLATGSLYLDDGVSITQQSDSTTMVSMSFNSGKLVIEGTFGFMPAPIVATVTFLNVHEEPETGAVILNGKRLAKSLINYDKNTKRLVLTVDRPLSETFEVTIK